jgi:hypothetical protein
MKLSLAAVSILACVLFGCATADPLEPRDFRVGAVREGLSQADVRRALGAPQEVKPGGSPAGGSAAREVWAYPSLEVRFSPAGTVTGIVLTGPRSSTVRGLHPGDAEQRLLVLHGSPYRVNGAHWAASAHNMPPSIEGTTWTYCQPRDPVCEHVLNVEFGPAGTIRTVFVGWMTK